MNIHKFIIHLRRDKLRKKHIKKLNISNALIFEAYDWKDPNLLNYIKESKLIINKKFSNEAFLGQFGCFLSHYKLWEYIFNKQIDYALIMEDDIDIPDIDNFDKLINNCVKNLPSDFDYLHLFIHPDKQNPLYLNAKHDEITKAEDNYGTVAYLVSITGIKKLLEFNKIIFAPIDRQINYQIQINKLNAYMIKNPFIHTVGETIYKKNVDENEFPSNIWRSKRLHIK